MNKIMVLKGGSPAIHKMGDIGRPNDDYIRIFEEDEEHYIGEFEEGIGFVQVKFKKSDCRLLSEQERNELNGKWYTINETPLYKIYVDKDGNVGNGKVTTIKGKITKVLSAETNEVKYSPFKDLTVEFGEDIVIGRSIIMFPTDGGNIQTSKVADYKLTDKTCIIHTNNSVYYIERV
ncbi:MAG: hypothetical protein PHT02_00630 [Tissierellia bacterium]|nr:hypothetical protein [Tissierellia bacterium]